MLKITDLFVLLVALGMALLAYVVRQKKRRNHLPFPPGPKKLPLLGNVLDLPKGFEWEAYARWGKEYDSDIIHLNMAGSDFIVLNSFNAATELLEKRSSVYSSRPQFYVMNEMMGWKWLMSALPYGDQWREQRRLFQKHFHANNPSAYQPTQVKFIRKMLVQLLETPEDFMALTRHTVGGMALSISYGLPIQDQNDPYINTAENAVQSIIEGTTPAAMMAEVVPMIKFIPPWIPGAAWQRRILDCKKMQENLRELPFEDALKGVTAGTAKPSFVTTCMSNLDENGKNVAHLKEVIKDTAGIVFAAGADTTLSGMDAFFLAMLLHPEVQVKAHAELDRVLSGRLPEFSDEPDLPYISAVVKEVLRWHPATPVGVPHLSGEEDVYEGWRIPKGAVMIANSWAMLHDEAMYPDPSSFTPERFLKDGKLNPDVRDPALMAFGFGRRMCPGNHIAISATWLLVATVLSTLQISKPLNEIGVPIEQDVKFLTGIICHPEPFKCVIKPRSRETEAIIKSVSDTY